MTNAPVIQERLAKLAELVERLRPYQTLTFEQFSKSSESQLVVERILQLATQIVIDIATHIVATASNKRPQAYEEAIVMLGDIGVLPPPFAGNIKSMAGFRNILVHAYLDIDESKVFENMQRGFEDFESFARYITAWLDSQGPSSPPSAK